MIVRYELRVQLQKVSKANLVYGVRDLSLRCHRNLIGIPGVNYLVYHKWMELFRSRVQSSPAARMPGAVLTISSISVSASLTLSTQHFILRVLLHNNIIYIR